MVKIKFRKRCAKLRNYKIQCRKAKLSVKVLKIKKTKLPIHKLRKIKLCKFN